MVNSFASRCQTTNKELERELRLKQKESIHRQRVNARRHNIDKLRQETVAMKKKTNEMKTSVGNRAKELVGYEQ